jgi:hypothetical protein
MGELPADDGEMREKLFEISEALKKEGVDVEISDNNQTTLNNIILAYCSKAGEEQFKNIDAELPRQLEEYHSQLYGFEERLYYRWSMPFSLFEYFIIRSQDINEEFITKFGQLATEEKDLVFSILLRLHAKACIVAKEVLTLMRSGYPDGASARCRTLNELAVISFFIAKHGNDVAERYMRHRVIEDFKDATELQKYYEKIGETPFSDDEMEKLHKKRENLIELYKKPFKERYGWAADALNNPNPNFTDIMRNVEFSHLLPSYRMASYAIHANSKCLMFKLASPEEDLILTGESNIGMADPGQRAAISLLQINVALLNSKISIENLAKIRSMMLLVNEINKAFIDVHNSIDLNNVSVS